MCKEQTLRAACNTTTLCKEEQIINTKRSNTKAQTNLTDLMHKGVITNVTAVLFLLSLATENTSFSATFNHPFSGYSRLAYIPQLIDWVVVLHPILHKIGHFGDVPQASLFAWYGKTKPNTTKTHIHQSKEMYYNTN